MLNSLINYFDEYYDLDNSITYTKFIIDFDKSVNTEA